MKIVSSFVAFLFAGCAAFTDPEPVAPRPWVPGPRSPRQIAERVATANAVVAGRVQRVTANWRFDDPCGVFVTLLRRCDGTRAYDLEITAGEETWYPMIFVPHDDWNPVHVGLEGVFLLYKVWATEYLTCRERAAWSSAACHSTGIMTLALLDTTDVLPLADSAAARATRRRR